MSDLRSKSELADVDEPAWPGLIAAIEAAPLPVKVLTVPPDQGKAVLHRLQVTARSMLGALALNCGGVLIDHGWLRVLGGGGQGLPDVATVNDLADPTQTHNPPPYLTVAFDVLGGRFAIDGGGLGIQPGHVCYWGPDTLRWSGLGVGHSEFVMWALTDGPTSFYADLRWRNWPDDVEPVSPSEGIAVYPPLFTAEAQSIDDTSRRVVPFDELLRFHLDMADQVDGMPDSTQFTFRMI
jgi:hypothetical protein